MGGEICLVGGTYPQGESHISGEVYTPTGHVHGLHDRGHLIANSLGGSDLNPANIVPLYPCANQRVMAPIEERVRRSVRNGETIHYRVIANHTGNDPVPDMLRITAYGDLGTMLDSMVVNTRDCM